MNAPLELIFAMALTASPPADPQATQGAEQADYVTLSEGDLVDFRYSFPTLVGSRPELLAIIRADRSDNRSEAVAMARDDADERQSHGLPVHRHDFRRDWSLAGQSPELVSLRSETETFTGGAHGMYSTGLLLWDEKGKRKLSFADLFASPGAYWPVLQGLVCASLASERLRRAEMESSGCPKPEELVFIPADTNSDWALDTIRVVADPYVAGSFVEGRYEGPIAVTDALIAALRPQYRESFEAQRRQ